MTIEVEPDRLDAARSKAIRKLSPKAKVPGFRPGKAPPDMVARYYGEATILDEALDDLVPEIYREALEADESIEPIARPRLEIETTEPLIVKATIPVRPTIELGDYASIRITPEPIVVEEARIDDTIEALRRRAATLEPMEREIGWRDVARIDVEGTVEVEGAAPTLVDPSGKALMASKQREPMVNKQEAEIQLTEDRDVLFPGFEEQLLGKRKGDVFEFDLDVPEGIADDKYKGKPVHFTVTILETKEEVLPEVDEEFLKNVGDGFESIDAFRDRIREDITKAEEQQRENQWHEDILAQLVERSTVEFPPVMLDAEVDRMLHDQFGHVQHEANFDEYLRSLGTSAEQVREQVRPIAEARLKNGLVLGAVTDAEGIDVSDEEIAEETETLTTAAGPQADQLRQLFSSDEGRSTIRRNLLTRKTLARLVELATQDAGGVAGKPKKPRGKAATPAREEAAATEEAPGPAEETPANAGASASADAE